MGIEELCPISNECYKEFVEKVFALDFKDKPDYDQLRNLLHGAIDILDM
jgi:hypothetical protein